MKLEFLSNEILLDLFEYLDGTDLLRAFYGLNSRLNFLLYKQYRFYCFQFHGVSKRIFDVICQQHLPFIADRVLALKLSNYKETPGQIDLFCSYIPSFHQFTHLQSLTFSNLYSYDTLLKLLNRCQDICNFTYLSINSCSFPYSPPDHQLLMNKIWILPKLNRCLVDINIEGRQIFCMPTIISTSLEFITYKTEIPVNQIHLLFARTPNLKYLSTCIKYDIDNDYTLFSLSTLIQLNTRWFFYRDISKMIAFFRSMPNLRHLTIDMRSKLIDGYQWEQIIHDSLPNLKIFRLTMKEQLVSNENIPEQTSKLINSFRTPFWIDEYRWFVRCITWKGSCYLYTVAGGANYLRNRFPESWQSTYPHDNEQNFYNSMINIDDETFFDRPISSDILLPNIKHLHINLPINDQFWSIVPNLHRLYSLDVYHYTDIVQSQLQTLLDRAVHLHTLRINEDRSSSLQMSLFKCINTSSVRELDLLNCSNYFNEEECHNLTCSFLASQCEVLSIQIKNRESIIHFVKNMIKLRLLIVSCDDDQYYRLSRLIKDNDELVQWLTDNLSSTFVIVREPEVNRKILIWM